MPYIDGYRFPAGYLPHCSANCCHFRRVQALAEGWTPGPIHQAENPRFYEDWASGGGDTSSDVEWAGLSPTAEEIGVPAPSVSYTPRPNPWLETPLPERETPRRPSPRNRDEECERHRRIRRTTARGVNVSFSTLTERRMALAPYSSQMCDVCRHEIQTRGVRGDGTRTQGLLRRGDEVSD